MPARLDSRPGKPSFLHASGILTRAITHTKDGRPLKILIGGHVSTFILLIIRKV
jgi:hypothetical protein